MTREQQLIEAVNYVMTFARPDAFSVSVPFDRWTTFKRLVDEACASPPSPPTGLPPQRQMTDDEREIYRKVLDAEFQPSSCCSKAAEEMRTMAVGAAQMQAHDYEGCELRLNDYDDAPAWTRATLQARAEASRRLEATLRSLPLPSPGRGGGERKPEPPKAPEPRCFDCGHRESEHDADAHNACQWHDAGGWCTCAEFEPERAPTPTQDGAGGGT